MNYFEIFDIPVQLKVDKTNLASKYFELSRKHHPDYYIKENPEKQQSVLEISALLNKAYKTFQNTDETIKYTLQLKGLLQEEEKYQLPPDFLMEVLDINEQLADMRDDTGGKDQIQLTIGNMQLAIYEPVKDIIEHYQEGITTEKDLLKVKEYYFKKKYLQRIQQQLNGMS
jgi:molecular chaperone HscB